MTNDVMYFQLCFCSFHTFTVRQQITGFVRQMPSSTRPVSMLHDQWSLYQLSVLYTICTLVLSHFQHHIGKQCACSRPWTEMLVQLDTTKTYLTLPVVSSACEVHLLLPGCLGKITRLLLNHVKSKWQPHPIY